MKNASLVLFLCVASLMAGCNRYYYQEGKTFNECAQDRHECVIRLKERLAVVSQHRPGSYEYKFLENCMKHRGYRLVSQGELPLGVKRLDPHKSMRGKIYGYRRGIAGTPDEETSNLNDRSTGGTQGHGFYRFPER